MSHLKKLQGYPGLWASQVALMVKNLPANAGDVRDVVSVPAWARSPGERYGDPLENRMDRGACRATAHGVMKNQTPMK